MKKQYYLKDKKAQIYRKYTRINESGYPVIEGYYPRAANPLWCYAKQLTQDQIFAANAANQQETRLFVFNYYSNIEVYNVILYRGNWYEITRVDTMDDYKSDMFIYVKELKGGNPMPEHIKPYDPRKWI